MPHEILKNNHTIKNCIKSAKFRLLANHEGTSLGSGRMRKLSLGSKWPPLPSPTSALVFGHGWDQSTHLRSILILKIGKKIAFPRQLVVLIQLDWDQIYKIRNDNGGQLSGGGSGIWSDGRWHDLILNRLKGIYLFL